MRHLEVDHPGELVQLDCFCIGRLAGRKGVTSQYTAIDVASAWTWAELHTTPRNPVERSTSALPDQYASVLGTAGTRCCQ